MASSYLKTRVCWGGDAWGSERGAAEKPVPLLERLWTPGHHFEKNQNHEKVRLPGTRPPPLRGSQPQGVCHRTKPRGQGPRGWTWKQTDPAANVLGVGGGAPVSRASPSLRSAQPALSSGSGSSLSAESESRKTAVITDGGICQSGRLTSSRDTSMRKPRAPTIRPGRGIRPKPPPPASPYSSGRGRREESPTPGIPRLLHKAR